MVAYDDQIKTIFITKWGTHAYMKIPCGLINVGAPFQRKIEMDFMGLVNKSIIIYLDDVTIFLKDRNEHLHQFSIVVKGMVYLLTQIKLHFQ